MAQTVIEPILFLKKKKQKQHYKLSAVQEFVWDLIKLKKVFNISFIH